MYHGWVPLSEHILLIELGIILHSDLFGHNAKFQSDVCNTGHTALVLIELIELINLCSGRFHLHDNNCCCQILNI